jgi:hypothetical protein
MRWQWCVVGDRDRIHQQTKVWQGSVALVGMMHVDNMILHSFQAWSTISVGLMAVDRSGEPRQRLPLHNDAVAFWPSCIRAHGYGSGVAFFARPHVLDALFVLDAMSYPEAGGSCVACPCVNSFELTMCKEMGGQGEQVLRVITVVVDGENPRRDQVTRAGAMIDKHSPCVCFILQLRGDMSKAIPSRIAEVTRCRADVELCHGSVGVLVGLAVAVGSDKKPRQLMDKKFRVKPWTCKRGEVDAAAIHFDFGGNPRGQTRRRRG